MKNSLTLTIIALLLFYYYEAHSQDSFEIQPDFSESFYSIQSTKAAKGFSWDNFSIGMSGGVNFSIILPIERRTIFSGATPEEFEKDYNPLYQNLGYQMGFIIMYDISRFIKLSLQPTSIDYSFKYQTDYAWTGNTNLQYQTDYTHRLRFFEVPLIAGLYLDYGNFQPYFQGGAYYGRLLNGTTDISTVETSTNLAGSSQSLNYNTSNNSGNIYQKNQYGVLAGAGLSWLLKRARVGIEANYKLLLSNLSTDETTYSNNQVVSGTYDVPDKFKFSNIAINIILIVPLTNNNSGSKGGGRGGVFCE